MLWLCPSMGYIPHLKCCFKSIWDKKLQSFHLRGFSFVCCIWNVHRNTLTPRNTSFPEKFLVARLKICRKSSCCGTDLFISSHSSCHKTIRNWSLARKYFWIKLERHKYTNIHLIKLIDFFFYVTSLSNDLVSVVFQIVSHDDNSRIIHQALFLDGVFN